MAKLFAMEEEKSSSSETNELLIDKLLRKAEEPKSPISLTADLLKQRQDLKKEIGDKLDEEPEENSDENEDDSSEENKSEEDTSGNNNSNENKNDEEEKEPSDSDKEKAKEEKDDVDAADDKESLNSLVGSGLSDKSSEKKEDLEDKKEEQATESFKTKVTLNNIFTPIAQQYDTYKVSLESYNLGSSAVAIEQQPIVYTKEAVIKSLNNLILMSNGYIENNNIFISKIADSVKNLNEKITVFKGFVEAQKYHFTNILVNDKDILTNIACPGKSDLRETSRILLKYIENSNKATSLVVTNEFDQLSDSYSNSDFKKEDNDFVYNDIIPGFGLVRLHLEDYRNYLTTKIQEYQYYKLKVLKTEDLFNLNAISITEDKELIFIMSNLDKLLVNLAIGIDNLKDINAMFTKFIDEIKVIIYDIEQDKYKDLNSISIDEKVKDFIRFKLSIEAYYINTNTIMDYITSVISVINKCVELKE